MAPDLVTTLIIAISASTVSPALMAIISFQVSKSIKKQDWDRQDKVADIAAKAAKEQLDLSAVAARKAEQAQIDLLALNSRAAVAAQASALQAMEQANRTAQVVDSIHILVNHNLTAAITATLEATRAQVVALKLAADGKGPGAATATVMLTAAQHAVEELVKEVADRERAQAVVDAKPRSQVPAAM